MSYPALTVKQLSELVSEQIKKGNGNKKVLISRDDEGNGYHGLFYAFTDKQESIDAIYEIGLFQDDIDPEKVVILG